MSVDDVDFILRRARAPLSPTETLVLIVLAEHRNGTTGLCNPSYGTIAKETRLDRSTVARTIRSLQQRGLVHRTPKRGSRPGSYLFDQANLSTSANDVGGAHTSTGVRVGSVHTLETNSNVGVTPSHVGVPPHDVGAAHTEPERTGKEPDQDQPAPPARSSNRNDAPFEIYAAIATDVRRQQLLDKQSDQGDLAERFNRRCVAQHLPYDALIRQKALDAALESERNAGQRLLKWKEQAS